MFSEKMVFMKTKIRTMLGVGGNGTVSLNKLVGAKLWMFLFHFLKSIYFVIWLRPVLVAACRIEFEPCIGRVEF